MICDAFSVLANHNLSVGKQIVSQSGGDTIMHHSHQQPNLSRIASEATSFLMYSVPYALQYHMCFLLASMVSTRDEFHQFKV